MTYSQLRSNYDSIVNAMKVMIMAQDELHQYWKLNYKANGKLAEANAKRLTARHLLTELVKSQPKVIEASIQELNKEYTAFLTRCQYFGATQQAYFDDTRDAKKKAAYQRLVKDMRERIQKYFQATYLTQQQQLL